MDKYWNFKRNYEQVAFLFGIANSIGYITQSEKSEHIDIKKGIIIVIGFIFWAVEIFIPFKTIGTATPKTVSGSEVEEIAKQMQKNAQGPQAERLH